MDILSKFNKIVNLSFSDEYLEIKYQENYLHEHTTQNILAAKIAIVIYLIYAPLTYLLILDEALLLMYVVFFSISMPIYLIVCSKYEFFVKNQKIILYFTGFIAGLGPVLFYVFTQNDRAIFQVDVLIPLIAIFTMYGISFSLALLTMLSIVFVFLILTLIMGLTVLDIFMAVYTMIIGGVVTAIAGYMIEKSKKKLFLSKIESDEFKYLIDNSHELITIYDIDTHKYLYANKAALDFNNYTYEDIITKTITEVHPELTTQKVNAIFSELSEKEKFNDITRLSKKNGEEYYAYTTLQYGFYEFKKVIINFSKDVTERKYAELKIQEMATKDPLTKLYNRYKLDEYMLLQMNQYKRYKKSFSFIICDIDFFKKINDTYGHLTGDKVLQAIAKVIQHSVRESDIVARWGGEEFAILLPNTSLLEAAKVAKKIHASVASKEYETVGHVYISCGVSAFESEDNQITIFTRVDSALYEAKRSGRNKVCVK